MVDENTDLSPRERLAMVGFALIAAYEVYLLISGGMSREVLGHLGKLALVSGIGVGGGLMVVVYRKRLFTWRAAGTILLGSVLGAVFISLSILGLLNLMVRVGFFLYGLEASSSRALWGALAILVAGGVAFWLRLRFRCVYGLTEVMVGVVVGVYRLLTDTSSALPSFMGGSGSLQAFLALLTASIYLVVRGLDNMHQGLYKEPKDPMAAKLIERFRRLLALDQEKAPRSP